ncbi:MAG: hypothetical protein CVV16_05445 [Gammaproteobacteria bacterium HGW-Gammaproteobacteria-6]|nr:MAG: hypothetical protein CVV16_05445 [Gammaproteobacteria bacterium HGW-Gammaproteobacteria-6]
MSDFEINNKILKECLIKVLEIDIGAKIEIAGSLYIRRSGESQYIVGGVEEKKPYQVTEWEETFTDAERALSYFFTKRNQNKIGSDFWWR